MDVKDVSEISKKENKTVIIMVRGDLAVTSIIDEKELFQTGASEELLKEMSYNIAEKEEELKNKSE